MSAAVETARRAARVLSHCELAVLALVYAYFLISDSVPLAALALIAVVWVARGWTTGRVTRATPLDLPVLLLLLWLPISLAVSTNGWLSLPKVYGVVLGVAFYYAIVNRISSRRDLAWGIFGLILLCVAIALAGLVGTDWAQGKIISLGPVYERLPRIIQGIPRSIAGGFARNGVGGTLTLTVPVLVSLLLASRSDLFQVDTTLARWFRPVVAAGLALSVLTLALTQSRGALLGTAIGLVALAILHDRRFAWLIAAAAVGAIALLALGYGPALVDFVLRMDARSGTLASRLEVWQRGVLMVQDFPFTGIGIGTFDPVAHSLYPFFIAAPDELVPHAHNTLLEVAVDVGIPGLIAYVALLTGFCISLVHVYRSTPEAGVRALAAGLGFGMLAHQAFGLTDAFILGTKPGLLMWIFFGLAVAAYLGRGELQGRRATYPGAEQSTRRFLEAPRRNED